jgi:hypothetical protein
VKLKHSNQYPKTPALAAQPATKVKGVVAIPFVALGDKPVALVVEAVAVPTAGGVVFNTILQLAVVLDRPTPDTVTTLPTTVTVPPHVFVKAFGAATFKPAGNV